MIRCAIIGATGFTGVELIKILLRHPHAEITCLTSRQDSPPALSLLVSGLSKKSKLKLEKFQLAKVVKGSDVVFLCLPHTESAPVAVKLLKAGKVVIDLGADFRLNSAAAYVKWYGGWKHPEPALLKQAVYGLTEFYRAEVKQANLIANPGCYPTGASLGLIPLLKKKLIDPSSIVIDSKSGTSGAGRKLCQATFYGTVNENFKAYRVGKHQHTPEIEMAARVAGGASKLDFSFVPHLLPVERGILTTIHAKKHKGVTDAKLRQVFQNTYNSEAFVRVLGRDEFPDLKQVQNTNFCEIGLTAPKGSDWIVVVTAIDNLIKGASGQAVQNMNVRFGFSETEGFE